MRLHGIDVSKYDESFLDKSIRKRIGETHCHSLEEYCSFVEQNKKEEKILLDSLSINYSEFCRNPLTFAVLERIVLPGMGRSREVLKCESSKVRKFGKFTERRQLGGIAPREAGREDKDCQQVAGGPIRRGRKELRIWSAACAGGQEAYSLAILLEELKNGDSEKFNYRIFATDQDESRIGEARKGQYPVASMGGLTLKRVNQWFIRHGETYTAKPELKENIDFSVFDLFSENLSSPPGSIFGDFDLVICANLLFYYKNEYRKTILEKVSNALVAGGFLVVGEAERDILMNYGYREVFPQSGIFKN
jgi:chemotaxis methyl-accepting protein methylase